MQFLNRHSSRPVYPYAELLGLIIGILFLSTVIRGTFDVDGTIEPLGLWHQGALVLSVILAWWSTFILLDKKKLSFINTGITAGIAAFFLCVYSSMPGWLTDAGATNLRLQIEQMTGIFVIFFISIFFFATVIQLLVVVFSWVLGTFKKA